MGYKTKDIAVITEPKILSLAALPNFIQFASKPAVKSYVEYNLTVNAESDATGAPNWPIVSVLRITEPGGVVHSFNGSTVIADVSGSVYFVAADPEDSAENLRQALLADKWVSANFDIKIPFVYNGTDIKNGRVLNIKSKGAGAEFNISLVAPNNTSNTAYTIAVVNATSQNKDSISGEALTAQISLDVYTDPPVFLGADDRPTTTGALGTFALSLSKTYSGGPLWFDVNAPFAQYNPFNVPPSIPGWFNTGTLRVYRFIARIAGINNYSFYQSNALYILNGYGPASDPINLKDYTYSGVKIKLLTNKPRTFYVKGQREYLNFLFSDPLRGVTAAPDWTMQIIYRAYTTADRYIGEGYSDPIKRSALNMVNTCVLRIDDVLTQFPAAGLIRVALSRDGVIISNDLEYTIRPASLHVLKQFSFLNRLGGWDSFNFDAAAAEDIKVTFDTFTKTITPSYQKGQGIETAYSAQLDRTYSVTGAPVTDAIADWLKELATSLVVLDSDGNYIIKSEFTAAISDSATNMQTPVMKYRISETYNNE